VCGPSDHKNDDVVSLRLPDGKLWMRDTGDRKSIKLTCRISVPKRTSPTQYQILLRIKDPDDIIIFLKLYLLPIRELGSSLYILDPVPDIFFSKNLYIFVILFYKNSALFIIFLSLSQHS